MSKTNKGIFITFEGPDGAGKTTHARRLLFLLESRGEKCILTREPGGTHFGERVRSILLDPDTGVISPLTELLLYESIRAHHVETVIRPAINRGEIVISDRFTDASVAYQGFGRGIPVPIVTTLNRIATESFAPDITVLIDVEPEKGLEAAKNRDKERNGLDRIESAGPAFHRRVRRGYMVIAKENAQRVLTVQKGHNPDETFREIVVALSRRSRRLAKVLRSER